MKSLYEIRDELASVYSVARFPVTQIESIVGFTQDVNFARRMVANEIFQAGFNEGVKAAQDRAQVLVDACNELLYVVKREKGNERVLPEYSPRDEAINLVLDNLENYKKSMETK